MTVADGASCEDLAGRVALVAGASRGVGAAIATTLAESGAQLVLAARDGAALEGVKRSCGGEERALTVVADLTREADVAEAVRAGIERFGRLDALVINAAVGLVGRIEEFSLADWQTTITTNVTGAFLLSREAIPHLRETRGAIIAIGSEFSRAVLPGLGAYAASKWALLALMQTLAAELRPDGVKVSSILPGGILTDFGPENAAAKRERQARGERFLEPVDVAEAVRFLLLRPERAWTQELNLWPY